MSPIKIILFSMLCGIVSFMLYCLVCAYVAQFPYSFFVMSAGHFFTGVFLISKARHKIWPILAFLAPCTFIFFGIFIFSTGAQIQFIAIPLAGLLFLFLGLFLARYPKKISISTGLVCIALYTFFFGGVLMQVVYSMKPNHTIASGFSNTDSLGLLAPDKQRVDNQILRNKIVVLDFWTSYCGPCFTAMPHFQNAYNKYRADTNILFISVNMPYSKDAPNYLSTYADTTHYTFPVMGGTSILFKQLAIKTIPHYSIFSKQGQLIYNGNISTGFENKIDSLISMAKKNKVVAVL